MKILILLMLLVAVFASPGESFAQRGMGRGGPRGWGPGKQYCLVYKPDTVETISCEVISVAKVSPRSRTFYGVHLVVKNGEETVSVHLGPGWYLEDQGIMFESEDKLEVTGSRITLDGEQVIIASEVNKGDEVLELRNGNGIPVWSGWRKSSQLKPLKQRGLCWIGTCCCRPCTQYCSMYPPNMLETVYGDVVSVEELTQSRGMSKGVHLILKTDEESFFVQLCSEWYLKDQGLTVNPDDKVEITGHRISGRGERVIIATEVKKGNEIFKLRDEVGLPFWRVRRAR